MHSERPGSKYFYGPQHKKHSKNPSLQKYGNNLDKEWAGRMENEKLGSLDFYNEPQRKTISLWAVFP